MPGDLVQHLAVKRGLGIVVTHDGDAFCTVWWLSHENFCGLFLEHHMTFLRREG